MSEQNKIYVPKANGKWIKAGGGGFLKVSFNVTALVSFARQYENENGYVTLCIAERREPGKFGDTHYLYLDTWKPKQQTGQPTPRAKNAPLPELDEPPF